MYTSKHAAQKTRRSRPTGGRGPILSPGRVRHGVGEKYISNPVPGYPGGLKDPIEAPSGPVRTGPNLFKDALISPRNAFLSVLLTFFGGKRDSMGVWQGDAGAPRWQLCPSSILDLPRAKIRGFRGETAAERPKHVFLPRESQCGDPWGLPFSHYGIS